MDPHSEIADPNADPDPGYAASKSHALTASLKLSIFSPFLFKKIYLADGLIKFSLDYAQSRV